MRDTKFKTVLNTERNALPAIPIKANKMIKKIIMNIVKKYIII